MYCTCVLKPASGEMRKIKDANNKNYCEMICNIEHASFYTISLYNTGGSENK